MQPLEFTKDDNGGEPEPPNPSGAGARLTYKQPQELSLSFQNGLKCGHGFGRAEAIN